MAAFRRADRVWAARVVRRRGQRVVCGPCDWCGRSGGSAGNTARRIPSRATRGKCRSTSAKVPWRCGSSLIERGKISYQGGEGGGAAVGLDTHRAGQGGRRAAGHPPTAISAASVGDRERRQPRRVIRVGQHAQRVLQPGAGLALGALGGLREQFQPLAQLQRHVQSPALFFFASSSRKLAKASRQGLHRVFVIADQRAAASRRGSGRCRPAACGPRANRRHRVRASAAPRSARHARRRLRPPRPARYRRPGTWPAASRLPRRATVPRSPRGHPLTRPGAHGRRRAGR